MTGRNQFPRSGQNVPRGTQLNNMFEIDELVTAGGMGEVYRGHNIQTNDPVAIKIVLPEFAQDEMILELFRKEARILNHLHHEAIVRYYVFSIDAALGLPFLAMEFVDGPSLAERIKAGPFDFVSVVTLQRHLADGLEKAHRAGVIHRDIAPDNIILPEGRVDRAKIIDFGIARSAAVGGGTLLGGQFAGKYNFVSPEQLGLFGGDVTNRSDIYSFGLVLAACILGRPLDMSGSQVDVIEKRRSLPDLTGINPPLLGLIEAMLQPDPQDRPQSMAEVADWPTYEEPEPDIERTRVLTRPPARQPSRPPIRQPSRAPTGHPSQPAAGYTSQPPTGHPSHPPPDYPSHPPTEQPALPAAGYPSQPPTGHPSQPPTGHPSQSPRQHPSQPPTGHPSQPPRQHPSQPPTGHPSQPPAGYPLHPPAGYPSQPPTRHPSQPPAGYPSQPPAGYPSQPPAGHTSHPPAGYPSQPPTQHPSQPPAGYPSQPPTGHPSQPPAGYPSQPPTGHPSHPPAGYPSQPPTGHPTQPRASDLAAEDASRPPSRTGLPRRPSRVEHRRDRPRRKRVGLIAGGIALAAVLLGGLGGWAYVEYWSGAWYETLSRQAPLPAEPPPPSEDERLAASEPAELTKPAEPAEVHEPSEPPEPVFAAADIRDFVRSHDGGSCFFAFVANVGGNSAEIIGYGTERPPFDALRDSFQGRFGFEAAIEFRQVSEPQCIVVDALGRLHLPGARPPVLELNQGVLRSGETLRGTVSQLDGRQYGVAMVDNFGFVHNLAGFVTRDADVVTFEIPLHLQSPMDFEPQLVISVASAEPLQSLDLEQYVPASELIPALLDEIAAKPDSVGTATGYFRFGS